MTSRHPPIDFKLIADAALGSARRLLKEWLPGGLWSRDEYKPRNPTRDDKHPGSFVINARTGQWIDNATSDSGGDLISLYAYINFCDQITAARAVAGFVGIQIDDDNRITSQPKKQKLSAVKQEKDISDHCKSPWIPILPATDDAPVPPVAHYVRGRPDKVYTYRDENGRVNGYVYLFTTSDGGKETCPVTFCSHRNTGKREWRWMAFSDHARPLYSLDLLHEHPDLPVLLVEGEKCADIGNEKLLVLLKKFIVITWQGGSKAPHKSDWRPLLGRKIFAWADCDSKRRKLTADEKKSGVDPESVPLMPESDQPGMRAMRQIHSILLELDQDIDFHFVDIPKPGDMPDGWDIADAVDDGIDLVEFISKVRKPPPKRSSDSRPINRSENGLLLNKDYKIVPCLANIYDILRTDERWRGVLAFNEFSYVICKLKAPPYEHGAVGEWDANDDVQASMWLTREYGFAPTPAQVMEAVEALARANGFHPVRNYLNGLKWDGEDRLDCWISEYIGAPLTPYVMRVSRWFLMGMVARVMEPGVKFDCCLVLEGTQGRRKSSMLRVLAGEWFGDTDLDLHNKDSMNSIRGKWLYEFAELGSLARAEATRQKSFLSRQVDEFRPPYARRDIRSPRQLVFGGTTNDWAWNKDETGGRRFWPIECRADIDCDGLAKVRDQLFAEAMHYYLQGKRFWPTSEEQQKIFDPEQIKRHQVDGYVEILEGFVKQQISDFKMADAAEYLKVDPARLSRDIQTRIGKALTALGCNRVEKRSNAIRFWYQPPCTDGGTGDKSGRVDGGDYGIPF